jgi:NAD(P)-dependent dehydrogenase (short-subunit alcohol dehydrogenase family)
LLRALLTHPGYLGYHNPRPEKDAAVTGFGRLDIIVNDAGIEMRTSVLDTTENRYDSVLVINLKSASFGTRNSQLSR